MYIFPTVCYKVFIENCFTNTPQTARCLYIPMKEQPNLFDLSQYITSTIQADNHKGKPRLNLASRNQVEFINACIDDLLAEDHPVRNIWAFISQMNLSPILSKIQSTTSNPGRAATDPKILFALWIYATVEGIGSARTIDRYCSEHIAFKWLCGGVGINYHTISDFRKNNVNEFDELITVSIARLMERDLVTLKRVSQDGMKVRASAGSSSFRRKAKLKDLLDLAKEQVAILKKELDQDPTVCSARQAAAKKRAARERQERIELALKEHQNLLVEKGKAKKKQRKQFTAKEKAEIRASKTDPEARKMKMGNGGFSPAYNFQLAVDTESRFIVNIDALKKNNDYGEMYKMLDQVESRYKKIPDQALVDQGYLVLEDIVKAQKRGSKVYVHPSKVGKKDAYKPHEGEDSELSEWRVRMGMDEAKEIYKDRASNSEWANAGMRNRGLKQLLVRGLKAVRGVLCLHALTHNIMRSIKLNYAW